MAARHTLAAILLLWLLCLPRELFKGTTYSTEVLDRNSELLGARIADDGQWRFPPCDSVPERFATALIQFEDKAFRYHPGVDPVAIVRAIRQNVQAGHTVSGASTITMQLVRLSRGKERTLWQKTLEAIIATRIELHYSKDEILAMYASHAPFGSNVVGLEAAAWRYFGTSPWNLSWSESATLAVLPNSPAMIHPGKNRDSLKEKRDRLLKRLYEKEIIDKTQYELSICEPLPQEPVPLPQLASQFVDNCSMEFHGERIISDIDIQVQKKLEDVTFRWNEELSEEGISDMSAIILDTETGKTLAYVGNANPQNKRNGSNVDIANSPRSTGSILKPFLYRCCLEEGVILPYTLLKDTPVSINGFSPQNFNREYDGAVSADVALSSSLNIPFVHLLQEYGVQKFCNVLTGMGMSTLTRSADDYGLSLILGGAEAKLSDLVQMYRRLACDSDNISSWYTLKALSNVNRPDEMDWKRTHSLQTISWKTGTSFCFRDAWAVGVTPGYVVGVWVGNANGQGSPGIIGARAAGPVLFDIFNAMPRSEWFQDPAPQTYIRAEVCRQSGRLAGLNCPDVDTLAVPKKAIESQVCTYHRIVDGKVRFVLPPAMGHYYRRHHPEYSVSGARDKESLMEFIYPMPGSMIHLPRQLDGSISGVTFNLAHSDSDATVFWHLDSEYLGSTRYINQMTLVPDEGHHYLTVVDDQGNSLTIQFDIV